MEAGREKLPQKAHRLGEWSLAFALLSVLTLLAGVAPFLALTAVVTGFISLNSSQKSNAPNSIPAIAGFVIGGMITVVYAVAIIAFVSGEIPIGH